MGVLHLCGVWSTKEVEFKRKGLEMKKPSKPILLALLHSILATHIGLTTAWAHEPQPSEGRADIIAELTPVPRLHTKDGIYELKVAGFIHFDTVTSFEDELSHGGDTDIRRARFGVRGRAAKIWHYEFMLEGSKDDVEIFDANLAYNGIKNTSIRVGQFKEPVGLEWAAGAPWWTFADRSITAFLSPKRSIGAMVSSGAGNWRLHLAWFGKKPTYSAATGQGTVLSARLHGRPVKTDDAFLHLGASVNSRQIAGDLNTLRLKAKYETSGTGLLSVDTGTIAGVSNSLQLSAEALYQKDSFALQGEYTSLKVRKRIEDTLDFKSWYLQANWFITGEQRPYKPAQGAIGRVKPSAPFKTGGGGGVGAIEVGARIGKLDLNDGMVMGGQLTRYTLGLNWYVNRNIRLTANLIHARVRNRAGVTDDNPTGLNLRAQFAF